MNILKYKFSDIANISGKVSLVKSHKIGGSVIL